MANGSANRIGRKPWGRKADAPASGTMLKSESHEKAPENSAIALKTSRITIEMIDTRMANLNDTAAPEEFSATKIV